MRQQLNRLFLFFVVAFLLLVVLLAIMEAAGVSRTVIGATFLLATLAAYATIGILARTIDPVEYYVAGRRVPAFYNGVAIAADWLSAASFLGLAGTLYLQGFGGLAYVLGWSGGFVLVAVLLAPYLRRFGQFTIPDFLAARYGGVAARMVAVVALIVCSFLYLVAQIYGIGLITSRLTGLAFEVGVFLGLGGVLVCSFLGGMRAITWTQVVQYFVLLIAFVTPVVWLSIKQTGSPLPQLTYGAQLHTLNILEEGLVNSSDEQQVQRIWAHRAQMLAERLRDPAAALQQERTRIEQLIAALHANAADPAELAMAEQRLSQLPRNAESARVLWEREYQRAVSQSQALGGVAPQAEPFAPTGTQMSSDPATARRQFLALVVCLMLGTASLPHLLVRFYTVPTVAQARQSVVWGLLFIALLYLSAPALAVMVKMEVLGSVVGAKFDELPSWVSAWSRVDASLLTVNDINHDGRLQWSEISIGADIIVLASAEIAGLPSVVVALVAAGGLAAALSTADGLLLTMASALSHDVYYQTINPRADAARRVTLSKVLLLVVALAAAYVAANKPANLLFLVTAAFSLAASAFFPALVLGIFWSRANSAGAVAGMIVGLSVAAGYMVYAHPTLRDVFGLGDFGALWWDVPAVAAGVFGVPAGVLVMVVVSILTPAPGEDVRALVRRLRHRSV